MSAIKRSYADIKAELEELLAWFESGEVDIDKAVEKHKQAKQLLKEMQEYLKTAEAKLGK